MSAAMKNLPGKRCDQWVLGPTERHKLIGGVSRRRRPLLFG
jgi:hypothetical protein